MKLREQHIYCETPIKEERITNCPFHTMKNPETMICTLIDSEVLCSYNVGKDVPKDCPLRKGAITLHYYLKGMEDD